MLFSGWILFCGYCSEVQQTMSMWDTYAYMRNFLKYASKCVLILTLYFQFSSTNLIFSSFVMFVCWMLNQTDCEIWINLLVWKCSSPSEFKHLERVLLVYHIRLDLIQKVEKETAKKRIELLHNFKRHNSTSILKLNTTWYIIAQPDSLFSLCLWWGLTRNHLPSESGSGYVECLCLRPMFLQKKIIKFIKLP